MHPAVVLGELLPGQPVTSTMALAQQLLQGNIVPSMFGICDVLDVVRALHSNPRPPGSLI